MAALRIVALACLTATAVAHTWLSSEVSEYNDETDMPLSVQDVSSAQCCDSGSAWGKVFGLGGE